MFNHSVGHLTHCDNFYFWKKYLNLINCRIIKALYDVQIIKTVDQNLITWHIITIWCFSKSLFEFFKTNFYFLKIRILNYVQEHFSFTKMDLSTYTILIFNNFTFNLKYIISKKLIRPTRFDKNNIYINLSEDETNLLNTHDLYNP